MTDNPIIVENKIDVGDIIIDIVTTELHTINKTKNIKREEEIIL